MTTRHPAEYRTVQAQRRRRGRAIRKMKRRGATTRQARTVLELTTRPWEAMLAAIRAAWDRIRDAVAAAVRAVARLVRALARPLIHNGRKPR